MTIARNRIGSPYAGVSTFPLPTLTSTAERPPTSPPESAIELTRKGDAYAHAHDPDHRAVRIAIEAEVERLISLLDDMDGDPDLEPSLAGFNVDNDDREGGDVLDTGEPSLGWTEMEARFGNYGESSYERELDTSDDEPSLGAPSAGVPSCVAMGFWEVRPYWMTPEAFAAAQRRHDDVWTSRATSQADWAKGTARDLEENVEDEGEETNEDGDELDRGESEELENGELDYGEQDGGSHIRGGGYHV